RESHPSQQRAAPAGTMQADEKSHLTAGGSGKDLAQPDERCVLLGAQPATLAYVGTLEVAEMCDRAAEGGEAEPQCDAQHLRGMTLRLSRRPHRHLGSGEQITAPRWR